MARNHFEDDLQRDVMDFIHLQYPTILAFHVPNGGKRRKYEAMRLKRQGVMAGVSDILLYWQGGYGAIELKAGKPEASKLQQYFGDRLQGFGGKFAVCNTVENVKQVLKQWGVK